MAGSPFGPLAARIAQSKVNTNAMASKGSGGSSSGTHYYDRLPPAPPTGSRNQPTRTLPLMNANPKQGHGRFARPLQREHGITGEPASGPRRSRV